MNHDSKHNDFEYEKETFPKTPEHFKQLVAEQVAQEQQKNNISSIKSKKKWMPAKVAAVIIVCATMGTTGAYAGIKQYQARSQQYLQKQDVSLLRKVLPKKKHLLLLTRQILWHQQRLYQKKAVLLLLFLIPGQMLC